MATGTVKWFNSEKGFGFIAPDEGGKDVFVHITALRAAGLETLQDDQKVNFEMESGRDGRSSAGNIELLLRALEIMPGPTRPGVENTKPAHCPRGLYCTKNPEAESRAISSGPRCSRVDRQYSAASRCRHRQHYKPPGFPGWYRQGQLQMMKLIVVMRQAISTDHPAERCRSPTERAVR